MNDDLGSEPVVKYDNVLILDKLKPEIVEEKLKKGEESVKHHIQFIDRINFTVIEESGLVNRIGVVITTTTSVDNENIFNNQDIVNISYLLKKNLMSLGQFEVEEDLIELNSIIHEITNRKTWVVKIPLLNMQRNNDTM